MIFIKISVVRIPYQLENGPAIGNGSRLVATVDYDKGLLTDLTAFNLMALDICSQVAEKEVTQIKDYIGRDDLPAVIKTALNALLTGIYEKHRGQ